MYYKLILEHEEDGIVWDQTFKELQITDLRQLILNIFHYSDERFKKYISLDGISINNIEMYEPFTIVSFTIDINDGQGYKLHINKLSLICGECGELSNEFCRSCGQSICSSHSYNGECKSCIHSTPSVEEVEKYVKETLKYEWMR